MLSDALVLGYETQNFLPDPESQCGPSGTLDTYVCVYVDSYLYAYAYACVNIHVHKRVLEYLVFGVHVDDRKHARPELVYGCARACECASVQKIVYIRQSPLKFAARTSLQAW